MELEIVGKKENPFLKRTEVSFRVTHPREQTPGRAALRQELAKVLHATRDIVVVDFSRSEFGRPVSRGDAKGYKSKEDALKGEGKPIRVRNGRSAAEVKAEKPAAARAPPPRRAEAPKPAEKAPPKEEKPAEKKEGKPAAGKKERKPAEKEEEGGKEGK